MNCPKHISPIPIRVSETQTCYPHNLIISIKREVEWWRLLIITGGEMEGRTTWRRAYNPQSWRWIISSSSSSRKLLWIGNGGPWQRIGCYKSSTTHRLRELSLYEWLKWAVFEFWIFWFFCIKEEDYYCEMNAWAFTW